MITLEFLPYPLTIGLLLLALAVYRVRRRGLIQRLAAGLFGLYILAAVGVVFFPLHIPANWPAGVRLEISPHSLNLIPLYYGRMTAEIQAGSLPPAVLAREILGNLLLTVPFGLGTGFFGWASGRRIFLLALAAGLALEGAQLGLILAGLGGHSVDINDVILNAAGVLLGYGCFRLWIWAVRRVQLGWLTRHKARKAA